MKPTGHRPHSDSRPRAARFGLGRAVAAAPAMLGSLLLFTLVSVTLGRWVGLLLPLAWGAGAAVLMTRVGEQMILRAACRFHRPVPAQAALLKRAWSTALRVTGTAPRGVELYVQTAGVQVPGLNEPPVAADATAKGGFAQLLAGLWPRLSGWPIALVLLIVWSLYLYVAVLVGRISRAEARA